MSLFLVFSYNFFFVDFIFNLIFCFLMKKKVQEVVLKDSPNETKDPEGGCAC